MKLKDLSVGQTFKFVDGNGKTYKKKSDNGDIATYNSCLCIDDLLPAEKSGLMIISSWKYKKMDKNASVVIVN